MKDKIESKKTDEYYLSFTDGFILRKLADSQVSNNARELTKYIISHLKHFCAFRLYDEIEKDKSECIATGDQKHIVNTMKENPVYQDFQKICTSLEKFSIDDFNRTQKDVELFAFRFEKYSLTKQLPFDKFIEKIKSRTTTQLETIVNFHYYRLGNGIPVLARKSYDLTSNLYDLTSDLSVLKEQVPNLIVDYPGSILHTLYNQQYVALRRYRVTEAEKDL